MNEWQENNTYHQLYRNRETQWQSGLGAQTLEFGWGGILVLEA